MKRSFQIIVSLALIGNTLQIVAGCPCARQKKHMRAKAAAPEVAVPLVPATTAQEPTMQVVKEVPSIVTTVVEPAPLLRQGFEGQAAPAPVPAPAPTMPVAMANNRIDLVNQADFDAHVTKHTHVVGVFTTTWCGPCKNLKPVLDELRNENKDVMFVYVDGDDFPGLVSKHVKMGFPTLKFFKNGKEVGQAIGGQSKAELQSLINQHYKGGAATAVMVEPLLRQGSEGQAAPQPQPAPAPQPMKVEPVAKTETPMQATTGNKIVLASQGDFDSHVSKNKNVIGVFTTTWCGPCKTLKPVLEELLAENKHVTFVYVDGDKFPGLVNKYSKLGFPTLKFFKNGKVVAEAIGGRQKSELQSMIQQHFRG